jgi:hypothetical protein
MSMTLFRCQCVYRRGILKCPRPAHLEVTISYPCGCLPTKDYRACDKHAHDPITHCAVCGAPAVKSKPVLL